MVVVVILVVVVNRMYKKQNGISLGRSPWRIDNCSIHRIDRQRRAQPRSHWHRHRHSHHHQRHQLGDCQVKEQCLSLTSKLELRETRVCGILRPRPGDTRARMGARHYDSMACGHCGPYGPWLSEAICRIYPRTLTIGQILTSV